MANKPDIVRLVDCNKRVPEPKYKYDENVLGGTIAEYRQINTGKPGPPPPPIFPIMDQISIKTPNPKCRLFLKIDQQRYLAVGV
jgi:hypothetical protein